MDRQSIKSFIKRFCLASSFIALVLLSFGFTPIPSSPIQFPYDEGTHHTVKGLEWWYVVIHARGIITGDRYSILVSHFNNQARFFNVTNVTQKTHVTGSTFGFLKSKEGRLDLSHKTPHGLDILRNQTDSKGELVPFQYEMKTYFKDMRLEAKLVSQKQPMLVGENGYGPVGSSGFTWYYSLTRIDVEGSLSYMGVNEPIEGQAWMDHQWGPFIVSPVQFGKFFESYEWFSIQLDNGYELMVSNIYNKNNELPEDSAYGDIQLFDPNGRTLISKKAFFTRTRYWKDPVSKKYFSMGWKIQIPEWGMDLTLNPEFENQMVSFPLNGDFWEGSIEVNGTLYGLPVKGKSFGELVHYFQEPELKFKNLKKEYDLSKPFSIEWSLLNPDAGNPVRYQVYVLEKGQPDVLVAVSNSERVEISARSNSKFQLKVQACSVDSIICGEVISPPLNNRIQ